MIYKATYHDLEGHPVPEADRQIESDNEQTAIDELIHEKYFLTRIEREDGRIVLEKPTKPLPIKKIKLDMPRFLADVRSGQLYEMCEQQDGTLNLTRYIFNRQPNTQMWDYVNQDVYIEFNPEYPDEVMFEDYGNGVPDWARRVAYDMAKVLKKEG